MEVKGNKYFIKEIVPKVYLINEFNLTTMFIIVGSERALVIDCGVGVTDFKACIESLTSLPYDVVCTHAHVDHIGGREQFNRIFLHKNDFILIKDITVAYRKLYIYLMKALLKNNCIKRKDWIIKKVVKEPEIIPVSEGFTFDLGNKKLEVIESPGHTLGSISIIDREDKIIFSGDAVNPLMLLFLKNAAPFSEYIKTGEKIKGSYSDYTVWASHFEEPLSKEQIDNNIKCGKELVLRRKNRNSFFPFVAITKKYNSIVIYKLNRIVDKLK